MKHLQPMYISFNLLVPKNTFKIIRIIRISTDPSGRPV